MMSHVHNQRKSHSQTTLVFDAYVILRRVYVDRASRQRRESSAYKYAKSQRGFTGAGHTRNSDDLSKRNIDINILQVVDFRSANQHFINLCFTPNT